MSFIIDKAKIKNENEIYNKYLKLLKGFYFNETRSVTLSSELASEAIAKVLLSMDSYKTNMPFNRWVYVIAKNNLIDYYRRNGSNKSKFNKSLLDVDTMYECEELGVESTDQSQTLDLVNIFMKEFDKGSQEIFKLSVFEGYSDEEIAEETGYKVGTVKHKLSYVKRILRKKLQYDK
jgi:RNA polymerase sigma-70 factor, ECF subfamily